MDERFAKHRDAEEGAGETSSWEEKAAQVTNQLSSFEFLVRKFIAAYEQDFGPFLDQQTESGVSQHKTDAKGLGSIAADVLRSFTRIRNFLESLADIRRIYETLCQDEHPTTMDSRLMSEYFDDAAIEHLSNEISTMQQSIRRLVEGTG